MSISGILTSVFGQKPLSAVSNPYQQQLQQLGKDLQSGNLSAVQSDFATLRQAFSQPATTTGAPSTTTSNPVNQAFNQLAADLQSGNLSAAQKDFSTVQQDIKGYATPSTNHFHHSHRVTNGGGGPDTTDQNSLGQDLNQLAQSLTSSNPAGAQRAYATLQEQLQQFALGSGDSSLLSNLPVSLLA